MSLPKQSKKPTAPVRLGRKRCRNCPKFFLPKTTHGGSAQLFCSSDCRKEFNRNAADFRKDNEAYQKAVAALHKQIRQAAANIKNHLTDGLGEPRNSSFGAGGEVRETVKVWSWKDHAILLSEKPGEGVLLCIMPTQDTLMKGNAKPIRGTDLKQELLSRVQHRANGDTVVGGIPMVTQGSKGYCVPATWARYLQYLGITVDEYILAEAAKTAPGGGTGSEIFSAVEGIVSKNHRQVIQFSGPLSLSLIAKYIDDGMPIMWIMSAVEPFEQLGRQPNRMGDLAPEQWSEQLKSDHEAARKLSKYKHLELRSHCCMIIGYNKITKEVATSDSWGAFAQERWFPLEAAQNVSSDTYSVIHW